MTIAVAATFLRPDGQSGFLLAADARTSRGDDYSDAAIKTFTLDIRIGAIESGDALSSATAIEMTRGMIADHNALQPETPFTFYNTIRVFSFFLDKIVQARPWPTSGSEVVLAGFLQNGRPALAQVTARQGERTHVHVYSHVQPGSLIVVSGRDDAKNQILLALRRACEEGNDERPEWPDRVASTIWYLSRHEGTASVGGGVALASCGPTGRMIWPLVSIENRLFLRGLDVTDCYCSDPDKTGLVLEYDETWHALTDAGDQMPKQRENEGVCSISEYVDRWLPPAEVVKLYSDPEVETRSSRSCEPRDCRHRPCDEPVIGGRGSIAGL